MSDEQNKWEARVEALQVENDRLRKEFTRLLTKVEMISVASTNNYKIKERMRKAQNARLRRIREGYKNG